MSLRKIKKNQDDKKDSLDPTKDEFITKTSSAFDWAYDHRRPLGLLLVLALVGAVAGIVVDRMMEKSRAEESTLVSAGLEAAFARIKTKDDEAGAAAKNEKAEDNTLEFDSTKARAEEALRRWTKLVKEGDPRYKGLGELEEAATMLDLGEYEKAVASYQAFLSAAEGAPAWLKAQGLEGLGYAEEGLGKLDEAKATFDKWMSEADGPAKKEATYHAARLAQKKGDVESAKKLFKEVFTIKLPSLLTKYSMDSLPFLVFSFEYCILT